MGLRFTVLASGSGGNSTLIEADGFGLLLDAGLGPRTLAERLANVGASWNRVQALLLTHTHSDHWNDRTLTQLCRRGLPLYCHADHAHSLVRYSPAFVALQSSGLVRTFEPLQDLALAGGLHCRPFPVRHDCGATFGFRLEGSRDLFGLTPAVAYLADLGCWDEAVVGHLTDVDILALEFNHDVDMEYASGRPHQLVARVLGDEGHLSNAQAADLLREVLARSSPGRLKHVVQLHLSRDCNRPELARAAARAALLDQEQPPALHTAQQDEPGPSLCLGFATPRRRAVRRRPAAPKPDAGLPAGRRPAQPDASVQRWLPGFEID
jgi:phosphoribosyl 1,2-cyclic phosphodiesterase